MPFEAWVERALEKWPDVPAVYGWLSLDRRGRWRIRGDLITRPQTVETIGANYACDEQGRWFFQNGPQRGYMALEWMPWILRWDGNRAWVTHTGQKVMQADAAYLDDEGSLLLLTEHGPAGIDSSDLDTALSQIRVVGSLGLDEALAAALSTPSGRPTALQWSFGDTRLPVQRLDHDMAPRALGFTRQPAP